VPAVASVYGYIGTLCSNNQGTSGQAREEDAASVYEHGCTGLTDTLLQYTHILTRLATFTPQVFWLTMILAPNSGLTRAVMEPW